MGFALKFGVIVDDINSFACNVADVVDVAELARLRINQNIALENFLVIRHDKRTLFGFAEESVDKRLDNAIVANGHKDIRLEPRRSLKVLIQNDFQIGIHNFPSNF